MIIPKPNNAQELFEELTTNEGLVAGLRLCGEPLDIRKRVVCLREGKRVKIRQQHFICGIPISRASRQAAYVGLWWVVSETGFSTILKEPHDANASWRAVLRDLATGRGNNKPYNADHLLHNLCDYLTVKALDRADNNGLEKRQACALLLALVDRLAKGKLVR